ncbi:MAG: hypothetical protein C5B58_06190 [Acidobacteria bacterium]|nr:MAG: hypothetical protein C5B58_06190 [Acidobacteriota bacterium]
MESWTLQPVTDADALRRLSALYRFVLGESYVPRTEKVGDKLEILPIDEFRKRVAAQFMCDYPISQVSSTGAAPDTSPGGTSTTTTINSDTHVVQTVTKPSDASKSSDTVTLVFRCWVRRTSDNTDLYKIKTAQVQRSQLRLPECVICIDENFDKLKLKLARTSDLLQEAIQTAIADSMQSTRAVLASAAAAIAKEKARDAQQRASLASDAAKFAQAELDRAKGDRNKEELRSALETARDLAAKAQQAAGSAAAALKHAESEQKTAESEAKAAEEAHQKRINAYAAAQENEALVADAGAFDSESAYAFLHTNTIKEDTRPFINPALVFKLLVTSSPHDCDDPEMCIAGSAIGSSGRHKFLANARFVSDPQQSFHDFELLVGAATLAGPAVSGAKSVVAFQTSPTQAILQPAQ